MRIDAPDELLDDYRLDGTLAMQRLMMPDRNALLIDQSSMNDALEAVNVACQRWGGASHLFVPCTSSASELPPDYGYLDDAIIDAIWTRNIASSTFKFRGSEKRVKDWDGDHFLVSTLSDSRYKKADFGLVENALPEPTDPWFAAYLSALGSLPETPNSQLVNANGFVKDLRWDQIFSYAEEVVNAPSGVDLLARLRSRESRSPTQISMTLLAAPSAKRAADMGSNKVLPRTAELAEEFGPNLVVLYTPGCVEDLCSIWNLRAANGHPQGLPLGLPDHDDAAKVLDAWTEEYAQTHWGLRHTRMALLSSSATRSRLETVAAEAKGNWEVVDLSEVLRVTDRPRRTSSAFVSFQKGQAEVEGWSVDDRAELAQFPDRFRKPSGTIRFIRRDRILPPLPALDFDYSFESAYRGGGFESPDTTFGSLVNLRWPAGWTVLSAVARDLDLRIEPSSAGQAAAAFLRHLKSWSGMEMLLSHVIVDALYRLGERSGMTWFRNKVREIGRGLPGDSESLTALQVSIDAMSSRSTDHDQHTIDYSSLVNALDRDAAEAWLSWAEVNGIVIRGVDTTCEHCGSKTWRAMGELSPPLVCRGCGRTMDRPFGPGQLPFRYRGTETLLRVLEHDALVHLFAMRYFARMFSPGFDSASAIYGMYPGVDFYERGSGEHLGETDLLVLLGDGSLVVGECKRHGTGLDPNEVAKLDKLRERLKSPWSFLATTDAAQDCPPLWPDSQRGLPDNPRFCLSAEQLFEPQVFWALGTNPLAWQYLSPEKHSERETTFRRQLPDQAAWLAGTQSYDERVMFEREQEGLDSSDPPEHEPPRGSS